VACQLGTVTRVQFDGNRMASKAHISQLGLDPDDEFAIRLRTCQIRMLAVVMWVPAAVALMARGRMTAHRVLADREQSVLDANAQQQWDQINSRPARGLTGRARLLGGLARLPSRGGSALASRRRLGGLLSRKSGRWFAGLKVCWSGLASRAWPAPQPRQHAALRWPAPAGGPSGRPRRTLPRHHGWPPDVKPGKPNP
jgi:hypothetical protein